MSWKKEGLIRLFPRQVDNNFQGYKIAVIIFLLVAFVTIARSCIHILVPDEDQNTLEKSGDQVQ